ncbi:MAG: sensor histidine kinase, partial [Candidatus Hodarchaeales archaeon]
EENESMIRLLMDLLSHDIRNYNSNTIGWVDVLEAESSSSKETRKIYSNIKRIQFESSRLVQNILNLNEIQERVLIPEEVSLSDCFSQAVKKTREAYPDVLIDVQNEQVLNGHIVKVHPLLIEVFFNLLTNAAKFKKPDLNNLIIELEVKTDTDKTVLYLSDNGRGIPESMKKILFQRKKIGNVREGLGLYIITQILKYFHCEIQVSNRIDSPQDYTTGTLFILSLPSRN